MIAGLGFGELALVFLVVLLLFGARRLPEIASSLGVSIRQFRAAVTSSDETGALPPPGEDPPPPA
ncbi:MAG TPA: twin-arginine translocase TatA/TatE family subunit [Longimicrobium sp.]|jgi:sec-independent protein translocase protein TatA